MCLYGGGGIYKGLSWGSPYPYDHSLSVLQREGNFHYSFYFFHCSWNGFANHSVGNKTIFYSDNPRTSQCQVHINKRLQKVLWSKHYNEALKQKSSNTQLLLSPATSWPVSCARDWRVALNRQEQIIWTQMQQHIWCTEKRSRWDDGPKALTEIAANKQQQ